MLETLFGRIVIPDAVYAEVVTQGTGKPGAFEADAAQWIDRKAVTDRSNLGSLKNHLHAGEGEVVILAEELNAELVIMDESVGRQELANRGIRFIGTVGLLIRAKRHGLIPALKPELDQLRASGFHLSERVRRACLAAVGE